MPADTWEQQFIAADAREVVDVARLGHSNGGMKQQVRFYLLRGAESEFLVRAMHGISGLKGDHSPPAETRKFGAQFRGCQAEGPKIVMGGMLQAFQCSSDVPGIRLVHGVVGAGMSLAGVPKTLLASSADRVARHLRRENRQHNAFAVAQSDLAASRLKISWRNLRITSSVIGIGQITPLLRRMFWQTLS